MFLLAPTGMAQGVALVATLRTGGLGLIFSGELTVQKQLPGRRLNSTADSSFWS